MGYFHIYHLLLTEDLSGLKQSSDSFLHCRLVSSKTSSNLTRKRYFDGIFISPVITDRFRDIGYHLFNLNVKNMKIYYESWSVCPVIYQLGPSWLCPTGLETWLVKSLKLSKILSLKLQPPHSPPEPRPSCSITAKYFNKNKSFFLWTLLRIGFSLRF